MPIQTTIKGEKVKEYLSRFPNTSKLSLAKKIFKENNLLFTNVDDARSAVRYFTGKMGAKNKKSLSDKSFLNNKHNPFDLPESDEQEWLPYILPKAATNILVLSDLHIPYHSLPALNAALNYAKQHPINTIFINGDLIDFHQISRFEKDPYKRRVSEELELTRQFLRSIKKHFPKAKMYFKYGNHDLRLEKFLRLKAPELLDLEEFKLEVLLRFGEMGIEVIKDNRIVKAGKLNILHGHEFQSGVIAPVNVARGVFLRAKTNTLVGHSHVTSEHTERDLNGDIVTCWSTGSLCELNPEYARINKFNHGFCHILVDKDGGFNVKNMRIIKGKIV